MLPFLHLRGWARSGSGAERGATAVAVLLVLGLVGWASVPHLPGESSTDGLVQTGPGAATATAPPVVVVPVVPGQQPAGAASRPGQPGAVVPVSPGLSTGGPAAVVPGATGATQQGSSCAAKGATDQGVTATAVTIGVSLPDLGGLGAAFNVPSVQEQQKAWDAVFAVYNKAGGVQCRKIVPKYYADDVTSATNEHATCLEMVQAKLFAVIQNLYFPEESTCLARNKVPNFWYIPPHSNQVAKYYPYILSYQPDYDRLVRDYVRGANALGWFKGYQKVGVLEGTCFPDLNQAMDRELTAIGVPKAKRASFSYGCDPGAPSQPDKDTQAVLQFQRAGVSHVLSVAYGRSFSFSSVADGQGYQPEYAVMDDGEIAGSNHSAAVPTGAGFDGALAVAVSQLGEADSPGVRPSPATARCTAIMKSVGLPSPVSQGGASYGSPCAGIAMFVAAVSHTPSLTRASLAAGLAQVGRLDLSFPAGPGDFHDARNPTGGGFWRPLRYDRPCGCWRVASAAFRKGFAP